MSKREAIFLVSFVIFSFLWGCITPGVAAYYALQGETGFTILWTTFFVFAQINLQLAVRIFFLEWDDIKRALRR